MKFKRLLLHAQVLVEGADDFDKWAHNEGEKGHACQHNADTDNFLKICNRKQVTIPYCG